MNVIAPFLLILVTIVGMEAFSWFIHKYLFHGPLCFIHQSHHKPHTSWFEFNDVFSLLFAAVSMYLMWEGRVTLNTGFWIGVGISVYGIIYFIFHDWFIHNRVKPFKTNSRYLLGIRRAHKIHHKSMDKKPSEEFGLLLASEKYFRKHKKDQACQNLMTIHENVSLKGLNTFGVMANARLFADIKNEEDLAELFSDEKLKHVPKLVLGGGVICSSQMTLMVL